MSELAPCPFCNSAAVIENVAEPHHERHITAGCSNENCFAYLPHVFFAREADAIAAWNRRATPTEWQDIESAPKDQKVLVAYRNPLGNWRIVTGCYHTHLPWSDEYVDRSDSEYAPEGWYEESDSNETIWPTNCPPTHWRELPAPPASRNGEGRT